MHSPEYTAKIKALIAAKDKTEGRLKNILYQFRNGWKVGADDIAEMKAQFAAVLEIIEPETAALRADLDAKLKQVDFALSSRESVCGDEKVDALQNALGAALALLGIPPR